MLFGVFAVHTAESCPLNNDVSKNKVIKMHESMELKIDINDKLDAAYQKCVNFQ